MIVRNPLKLLAEESEVANISTNDDTSSHSAATVYPNLSEVLSTDLSNRQNRIY